MLTCKILIVDDDSDDLEILVETFNKVGVERALGVSSAEEAISFLQSITNDEDLPELIVTDLNMPGINGHELLRALKEMSRYQHIPVVVVCSTSDSIHEMERCLRSGARDYLTKPNSLAGYLNITRKMCSLALT
jgi:CheY-like chemotaxis protein